MSADADSKAVKIIADGLIGDALSLLLRGAPFVGEHVSGEEALVVYAHALDTQTPRRSVCGGLKRLQQILAHPSSVSPVAISILSLAPPADLKRYSYLVNTSAAIRFTVLPDIFDFTASQPPSPEDWRRLTRFAAEEELEIACAGYRHGLMSLMAAARIYLGAAIVGHIKPADYEAGLAELERLARAQPGAPALKRQDLLSQLGEHQRFKADYNQLRKPEGIKVWALDDNWTEHGWRVVLENLFPATVRGFQSWGQLEAELEKEDLLKLDRPDVLLLDCNLGSDAATPTGLELLYPLRSRWPEVRILFATAYDDAALALTSLREGANLFFAKALNDTTDRRSLDYYKHFTELLSLHQIERSVAKLWRTLITKTPLTIKGHLPPPPEADALRPLINLGFYLLFSIVDKSFRWGGQGNAIDDAYLFQAVVNLIAASYPPLEELAAKTDKPVERIIKRAIHSDGQHSSFDDLRLVMEFLFEQFEDSTQKPPPLKPWSRQLPDYWPYRSITALQTDSSYPGLPEGAFIAAHEVADSQGAMELVRGVCCSIKCKHGCGSIGDVLATHKLQPSQLPSYKIVYIDDGGDTSGWFEVVRQIFPQCRVFTGIEPFLNQPGEVDLLLLDLRLPTAQDGLTALQKILMLDATMPVLAISASSDSWAAIKSLRLGAIDFISKTLPGKRDESGRFQFADEFLSKCELILKYGSGKCRGYGRQLQQLRSGLTWPEPERLSEIHGKVQACHRYKERMGSKTLKAPPAPETWIEELSSELALLLRLRQQLFLLNEKKRLPAKANRLNFKRTYRIRMIDHWRWEHVLSSKKTPQLARLSAILAGVIVDRLAQWNWSLSNEQALNTTCWGATHANRIEIAEETRKIRAEFVWERRNDALHPQTTRTQTIVWNESLCDEIIERVFGSIFYFFELHGGRPKAT